MGKDSQQENKSQQDTNLQEYHIEEENLRKYYSQMPNIIDDLGLSVYAFRLYGHLKRVAGDIGKCTQSVTSMSKHCGMSRDYIVNAKKELLISRDELNGKSLIFIQKRGFGMSHKIMIVDVWKDNIKKFLKQSTGSTTIVEGVDYCSRTVRLKEEHSKKEQENNNNSRTQESVVVPSDKSKEEIPTPIKLHPCLDEIPLNDEFKKTVHFMKDKEGNYATKERIVMAVEVCKRSKYDCIEAFFTDIIRNPEKYKIPKDPDQISGENKERALFYQERVSHSESGVYMDILSKYVEIGGGGASKHDYIEYSDSKFEGKLVDKLKYWGFKIAI